MAKYLITSGSHFTPFTYDQLVKPVAQLQEAHNATADAYDQLALETSALERYISDSDDDAQARQLYTDYKNKLKTLQDNLWSNGYNAQTRRDLSAAKAGYATDISRLGKAIQARQERSKAYWDTKAKNPDMIMGADPGQSGLDNYLNDDLFGQNYYTYSGTQFMKEVATDAAQRANEMLRNPQIMRDPRLAGYITRVTQEGFTSQEVSRASAAVRASQSGDNTALEKLSPAEKILADVFSSHLASTGALGKVSDAEYERLMRYGEAGLSSAIGKTHYQDLQDREYLDPLQRAKAAKLMAEANPAQQDISGIGTYTYDEPGENYEKALSQYKSDFGEDNSLVVGKDGKEYRGSAATSDIVYSGDVRREAYKKLGFDIGRNANKGTPSRYLTGEITRDGVDYETLYDPQFNGGEGAVRYRVKGSGVDWRQAQPSKALTDIYNAARKSYETTLKNYRDNDPELFKAAKINPDKQYDIYKRDEMDFTVPLTDYKEAWFSRPENNPANKMHDVYVAREGTDPGQYTKRISGYIASGLTFDGENPVKDDNIKSYKNTSKGIHKVGPGGSISPDAVQASDAFTFDKQGNITNIQEVKVSKQAIVDMQRNGTLGNGYIIVKTSKGTFSVGLDQLKDNKIRQLFAQTRSALAKDDSDKALDYAAKYLAKQIQSHFGYDVSTVSRGGTSKDELE